MADPRSIVPYHDPYDNPFDYDYLNYMSSHPNPTLASLSSSNVNYHDQQQVQMLQSSNVGQSMNDHNVVGEPEDPLEDPMLWDIFVGSNNNNNGGNPNEAGPSQRVSDDHYFGGSFEEDLRREGISLDGGRPLPDWPPPPVPFGCTCCHVLRELIHTDGNCTTKLEIHGRLGLICHAVLQSWDHINAGASYPQHHMFDFCKKSIEDVKQFLKQYCSDRKNAGFIMAQDPLSIFYEALTVGLDSEENIHNDDFFDLTPTNSAERPFDPPEGDMEPERMHRSHLALQRERAGRLSLKDFENYFHLPIEEAARRLNLCPTVVKKICRRDGMTRWPYRKIKSFQRQISNLRTLLNSENEEERANAQAEIARLEQEIVNVCTGNRER